MATLTIGDTNVQIDDQFLTLPPDQQNAAVEEIANSLGIQKPGPENSLAGSAKAVGSGLVSGLTGIAGLPADALNLAARGVDYLSGNSNVAKELSGLTDAFGSEGINKVIGNTYQPQTGAEKFLNTTAGFAPAALLGPGGIARRIATNVVVPGVASEAAGQATEGTPYEPVARIAGALTGLAGASKIGSMADLATAKKALPPVPTLEQIGADENALFNTPALKEARLSPPEVQAGLKSASDNLKSQYFDATPGTPTGAVYNVLGAVEDKYTPEMQKLADKLAAQGVSQEQIDKFVGVKGVRPGNEPLNGPDFSFQDLHNIRKRLGEIKAGTDKSASKAAGIATEWLDNLMPRLAETAVTKGDAPQAAADLAKAIETSAARFRSQRVEQFLQNALIKNESRHSGGNLENYIYQEIAKAKLRPDKYLKGWSGAEKEALFSVMPGPIANANRRVSKLLGGGGGLGQLVAGIGGASALGPIGGFALPAVGMGLRKAGELAAQSKLEKVSELVRARAPSYSKHYADYLKMLDKKGLFSGLPPKSQLALQALLASRSQ